MNINIHYKDKDVVIFGISDNKMHKTLAVAYLDLSKNEIRGLLVEKNNRKKGLGTKLLLEVERYAEENEIEVLHAVTHPNNVETRNLFKSLGYKEWIKMEKKIGGM